MNSRPDPENRTIRASEVHPFPVHQSVLTDDQVRRIRLIRAALWEVYPKTMEFWLDGFRRDAHPEPEIAWWEHLAACYLEFVAISEAKPEGRGMFFTAMSQILSGTDPREIKPLMTTPHAEGIAKLMVLLLRSKTPLNDDAAPTEAGEPPRTTT